MSDTTSKVTATLQVAPIYLVFSGDFLLDGPLKQAYKHVLNYPSWQNYTAVQHVSGNPGEEGELVILKKEEEGFSFPPYYARTIKIEPERRLIWKVYPVQRETEGDFFGIVDFKVCAEGENTRFSYNALYEFQVPFQNESDLDRFRIEQSSNFEALLAAVFPKLRQLVATDG
jgi:hypothetical protein